MRINNTGNVGIGVDPAYDLDIKAGSSARVAIDCSGGSDASIIMDVINADFVGSDYYLIKAQSSGEFAVFKASSERIRITPDGDIGINCTPSAGDLASGSSLAIPKVMIQGPNTDASHHLLRLHAGQDADWNGAILTLNHSNDRGIAIYGGRSNSNRSWGSVKSIDNVGRVANCISMIGGNGAGVNRIMLYTGESTSTTERMRITSSGCLLIGRTSNSSYNNLLQTKSITVETDGDTTGMAFNRTDSSAAWVAMRFYAQGSQSGYIQINTSTTTYNTGSDYRLKENVVSLSDGIARLKTLKPYRFNFIEDKTKTVDGFFAHEVTAVPEAVSGEKDAVDEDGNPDYQVIDHSKLVPLLTAALQEAIAKIEVLETKVAALEA